MAETVIEEIITEKEVLNDSPKARLEKFLQSNPIQIFTEKDFKFPKDEKKHVKIRAEVDEFLQILEDERNLSLEREESRQ